MADADRIDGYASAILEIARAEGRVAEVGDELFRIARSLEGSNDLRDALVDSKIPSDRKLAIVEDLIGDKASALSVNLVALVVSSDRGGDLPAIADRLAEMAAAERDKVIGEVRTAVELDAKAIKKLEKSLSRATGKDVEVKTVIDPTVIGGVIARVGDTVIDGSLKNRMDEIRQNLTRR